MASWTFALIFIASMLVACKFSSSQYQVKCIILFFFFSMQGSSASKSKCRPGEIVGQGHPERACQLLCFSCPLKACTKVST